MSRVRVPSLTPQVRGLFRPSDLFIRQGLVRLACYEAPKSATVRRHVDSRPKYPAKPVIGLKVDTADGSFIVPIVYEAAKDLSECILRTLLSVAPELFY